MEEYIDLTRSFETKKRSFTEGKRITISLPSQMKEIVQKQTGFTLSKTIAMSKFSDGIEFKEDNNKLRVDGAVIKELFDVPVRNIVDHVKMLLRENAVKLCKAIVMVGGLSESPVFQEAIRQSFPRLKVIIPTEAGLAVLKGAAIFGFNPRSITERVCRYTYGVDVTHKFRPECRHRVKIRKLDKTGTMRCYDLFDIHAKLGQAVKLREEQPAKIYHPLDDDQQSVGLNIVRSTSIEPKLITDPGCEQIGYLNVPLPKYGNDRSVRTTFLFGGTEIVVKVTVNATGKPFYKRIDFLDQYVEFKVQA